MTHRRIATGGPLNFLNENAGTNSRGKSVPVMALVSHHRPATEEELEGLIEQHSRDRCICRVRSHGSVADFGKNLYEAQLTCTAYKERFPLQRKYTLDECYEFMRNLFCVAPLRGLRQEEKSIAVIRDALSSHKDMVITLATRREDFDFAVDYIVQCGDRKLGVQVKPESFFDKTDCVEKTKIKHEHFGHPVHFHTYSNRTMEFLPRTTEKIICFFVAKKK